MIKKEEFKERKEAFASLPKAIKNQLVQEEIDAFLHKEVWPESLCEKLSEFIYPQKK